MRERIHGHLRVSGPQRPEDLAERFLKLGRTDRAAGLVRAMLGGDPAFEEQVDGRWLARERPHPTLGATTVVTVGVADGRRVDRGLVFPRPLVAIKRRSGQRIDAWRSNDLEDEPAVIAGFRRFCADALVVTPRGARLQRYLLSTCGSIPTSVLTFQALARALSPGGGRTGRDVAAALGVRWLVADEPEAFAEALADVVDALLGRAEDAGISTLLELERAVENEPREIDFSGYAFDREELRALPARPGVYVMSDAEGRCLYVGKSRRLRHRLWTYFRARSREDPRVAAIVASLHALEAEETGSELGALVLEHARIRMREPLFNHQRSIDPARSGFGEAAVLVPAAGTGEVRLYVVSGGRIASLDFPRQQPSVRAFTALLRAALLGGPCEDRLSLEQAVIAGRYIERARDRLAFLDLRQVVSPREGAERLHRLALGESSEAEGRRVT